MNNSLNISSLKLWYLLFIIFWSGILAACNKITSQLTLPEIPPLTEGAVVQENKGRVCFRNLEYSMLQGIIQPQGCYSSSCTDQIQQVGAVTISDQNKIQIQSRFVIARNGGLICTADCGGGGYVEFDIDQIEQGIYSVWLGEMKLGDIEIPPRYPSLNQDTCLSSEATATPLP